MYNSDKPIAALVEDKLGRSAFAQNLVRAINGFQAADTFVVGLYGDWGSGKTSIINMVLELLQNPEFDQISTGINYNPWKYADSEHFEERCFQYLSTEIAKVLPEARELLLNYARAFNDGENISNVLEIKAKLNALLKNQSQKILVIIDDIDRLDNQSIASLFRMVNAVIDFPNVVYLMAFDKNVVIKALEKVQEGSGEEYLKKIIQVPFIVPQIDNRELQNILWKKLRSVIELQNVKFDEKVLAKSASFCSCVYPFLKNIRDVNRLVNTFRFYYPMICYEVNLGDFLAVTSLHTFAFELVQWLTDERVALCNKTDLASKDEENIRQRYLETFRTFKNVSVERCIAATSALFPQFAAIFNRNSEIWAEEKFRKEQRVAHIEKFDVYFMFSLQSNVVSRRDFMRTIEELNEFELENYWLTLNGPKLSGYFKELSGYIGAISTERLSFMAINVLRIPKLFQNEVFATEVNVNLFRLISECVFKMMTRLAEISHPEVIKTISEGIKQSNRRNFSLISEFLYSLESAHGRLGSGRVRESEKILTIPELGSLEQQYFLKIKELSEGLPLNDWNTSSRTMQLWEVLQSRQAVN